jgi:putative pyruvate formate lyase activating enzyme
VGQRDRYIVLSGWDDVPVPLFHNNGGSMSCNICPRLCNVNREVKKGFCSMGESPVVAKAFLHMWEEPCISGTKGSGTVFFSGCNLKCVFCQNYTISQENFGKEISPEDLTGIFEKLQNEGAHNINLVNPTHFVIQIKESISESQTLNIPVVYNSNGYESMRGLQVIEGSIDVFLPDLKYYNKETSKRYSGASDYFDTAAASILEMYRQVGNPVFDENGIIQKGLIIRHLILPGMAQESIKILDWIAANLPKEVMVSVMSQYTPYYKAGCCSEINRRITRREYEKVVNHVYKLGLENGYIQERDSAVEEYIPDFNLEGL